AQLASAIMHKTRTFQLTAPEFPGLFLLDFTFGRRLMRWILLAAAGIGTAALLVSPMAAAPPEPASADAAVRADEQTISFEQYRDWRLHFIEQPQTQLTAQLAAPNLTATQRSRLQQKAYYDWFAALPEADRDRRFRERFDQ